jgi:RHS repeat-associated protein
MADGTGTSTYTYDDLGRQTSVTDGAGHTVAAAYDAAGRISAITYPDGRVVKRDHDALGRLVAIRDWLGNESAFEWDVAGRLTGMRQGDGIITSRIHDARGDLLAITVTAADREEPLLLFAYERDALGRVSSITGSLDPVTKRVSRDTRGRLTAVGDEAFATDAAGNLTGLRGSTLTYDTAGRLVAAQGPGGSSSFTSDAAGQRTSTTIDTDAPTSSTWDAAGRLVAIGATSHTYDGDGLRVGSTLGDGSTSEFTWLRSVGLPLLLGDGSSWFIHGPGGMPLEEIRADGSVAWLHLDQAGSVRAQTDEAGAVSATLTWDAYGLPAASTGAASTRLGFQGQYTDLDTGLQYLQARFYDPVTARFLTIDPLVLATREPYAFAHGDPLTYGDPSGAAGLVIDASMFAPSVASAEMMDAMGFDTSSAAVCELVDLATGDPSGMLSDLGATFGTGTGVSRIVSAIMREEAKQQELGRVVQGVLRGLERSGQDRLLEAMRGVLEGTLPLLMETVDLTRPFIEHVFDEPGSFPARGGLFGPGR